jgi:hypothetical protein
MYAYFGNEIPDRPTSVVVLVPERLTPPPSPSTVFSLSALILPNHQIAATHHAAAP